MPKVRTESLHEVEEALKLYVEEVERSSVAKMSKRTYIRHARTFVRWLDDDFTPNEQAFGCPTGQFDSCSTDEYHSF